MKNNPIYVIDFNGQPLMPTFRYGKVRHMLKNNQAKIIKRDPFFTIQLLTNTSSYIQYIIGGIDIGETVGISVINPKNNTEILSAELKTRSKDIPDKLKEKTQYRRTRRNHLRYRTKRFENRKSSLGKCKVCGGNTKSGKEFCSTCLDTVNGNHNAYKDISKTTSQKRLAPSVNHLIDANHKIINKINEILPIKEENWIYEKVKFDIQKIENIDISGVGYQQGDMFGFSSLREYILERDEHTCQNPNCKHKNIKNLKKGENVYLKNNITLVTHHIIFRHLGGTDKPSNYITLCTDCHIPTNHLKGYFLYDWCIKKKKVKSDYKAATKMNVVASSFDEKKNFIPTFGSETKRKRQLIGLDKTHSNDALSICIDKNNFDLIDDSGKKKVVLKRDFNLKKIEHPDYLIQTNGRSNGRRALSTFQDSKYIDIRDGKEKSGKELSKEMDKRTLINNNRIYRGKKTSKGSFVKRTGISEFPNNSIIEFTYNGKHFIKVCGGVTGYNVYVKDFEKKTVAIKKCNVKIICKRKGVIKK
jgi:N6-L-threonylcarbamoyladenine synthase